MGKTYTDWDEFDTAEYAWRCYGKDILQIDQQFIEEIMDSLGKLGVQPESITKLADIGTGPNLYPALVLAPFVRKPSDGGQIDLVEYSAQNREYLQRVIDDNESSRLKGIWNKYEDLMAGRSQVWRGTLQRTRQLAKVRAGDIYHLEPGAYDAISSFFVTESITNSIEDCERAVRSLLNAVKPGGLVIVGHMIGSTEYLAGDGTTFPAVPLANRDLLRMYQEDLDDLIIIDPQPASELREDYHGAVVVLGKKKQGEIQREVITMPAQDDTQKMFTVDGIESCLYDKQRTAYLRDAIFATIQPGDVVVDAGSGSGILGLFAAQAGASKVYCVELNPEYIHIIEQNARANGVSDKIVPICADATTVVLPEKVDVIISEIISGGFFYEPQLQVLTNLRRYLKPGGATVPAAMANYLELIDAQDEWFGVKLMYDSRYHTLEGDRALTTRAKYLSVDFRDERAPSILSNATVRALQSGVANALRIPYTIQFFDGMIVNEPTKFLLNPQTLFLPEPIELKAGEYYNVTLAYQASGSPLQCNVVVKRLHSRERSLLTV
jgi:predicted RNA methylase